MGERPIRANMIGIKWGLMHRGRLNGTNHIASNNQDIYLTFIHKNIHLNDKSFNVLLTMRDTVSEYPAEPKGKVQYAH